MPAKTPEQARAYDAARRRSKRLKLRLTEEEARLLRNAAASAGMALNNYMLALVDGRAHPIVDLAHIAMLPTAFAAIQSAPRAVHDLEADLGRLSGRLAHLFTMNYDLALEHRVEIHTTLDEVRALQLEMIQVHAVLQAAMEEPRAEIVRILQNVNAALEM